MGSLNSETIDLIATDPPFNKGTDFHGTKNSKADGASFQDSWSWDKDIHEEWTDQIQDDHPALHQIIETAKITYGMDMAAYLCYMSVRCLQMHRILKESGIITLHCNQTASHYLKIMLDAIFGKQNFVTEIILEK